MTAARHFDKYAAIPGHDEIVAMAPAYVYSVLAGDTWTQAAIVGQLAEMGATPQEAMPLNVKYRIWRFAASVSGLVSAWLSLSGPLG